MAKAVRDKNPTPKKLNKLPTPPFRLDIFLIEVAGRFGITGAGVLALIYLFFQYSTLEQKREFIDKFILLKTQGLGNSYVIYLGIFFVVLFIFQNYFFRKKDKLKNERIKELEEHIEKLEERHFK